jgi:hypothetical protein
LRVDQALLPALGLDVFRATTIKRVEGFRERERLGNFSNFSCFSRGAARNLIFVPVRLCCDLPAIEIFSFYMAPC